MIDLLCHSHTTENRRIVYRQRKFKLKIIGVMSQPNKRRFNQNHRSKKKIPNNRHLPKFKNSFRAATVNQIESSI